MDKNIRSFTALVITLIYGIDMFYCLHQQDASATDTLSNRLDSSFSRRHTRDFNNHYAEESDYSSAEKYAASVFEHLKRFENQLVNAKIRVEKGLSAYNEMLASKGDDEALNLATDGFINLRASLFLIDKKCSSFRRNTSSCLDEMKRIPKLVMYTSCNINKYRTYDGVCNNYDNPTWGSTYTSYSRLFSAQYSDGLWEEMSGAIIKRFPSPLFVGKKIPQETDESYTNFTLALASWTNLVSYDLAHTVSYRMMHTGRPIMCCTNNHIKLSPRFRHPLCMPIIDSNNKCMNYVRSMLSTKNSQYFGPAQQMNAASHYLDGSSIYGSTEEVAKSLRLMSNGHLKELTENCGDGIPCLITGDVRPYLNPVIAIIHKVLMKEHNRIADSLHKMNIGWDDELLYQEARRIVIAEIQHITYTEWLPILIGSKGLDDSYDPGIHPGVYNSFANAAIQFVFSLFSNKLSLYNEDRTSNSEIPLRFSMIDLELLKDKKNFDSLIRSLATQQCQKNDLKFSEPVTDYLYSETNETGYNAVSLVVQRGRDHGLPPYTYFRNFFGLAHRNFFDLTQDIPKKEMDYLKSTYANLDFIDLFIGGIAESPTDGALLGPIFAKIIHRQMITTKKGDRYFYSNTLQDFPFTIEQLREIKKASLARLLCDNGENIKNMQPNAFKIPDSYENQLVSCADTNKIKKLNLLFWKEN